MNTPKEIPFEFFKDAVKRDLSYEANCKETDDIFISFCVNCRTPMTVKTLLNHSKAHSDHEIKSLAEMKKILEESLSKKVDNFTKNLKKIEKFKTDNIDKNKLDELKQKGLQKLAETRKVLLDNINSYFVRVENNWIELFDENFLLNSKKETIIRELNILMKIHLRAKQSFAGKSDDNIRFNNIKEAISTNDMIKDNSSIARKCRNFISKLDRLSNIKQYPELNVNKLMLNNVFDNLKQIFDYNFDFSMERLNSVKLFKFKIPDFYKNKSEGNKSVFSSKNEVRTEFKHKYLPVIAKNRRLMVYDIDLAIFKELMLSEIHSIPQGNQILVSPFCLSKFFIIGGHFFKKASNKFFELDNATSDFKTLPSLLTPRWMHRAVCYKNFIYIIGGTDNEKEVPINSVERYDMVSGHWERMADMKNARHSHTITIYQPSDKFIKDDKRVSFIYVFGGINTNSRYETSIEKFDLDRNSWATLKFNNAFDFCSINGFAHQLNDNEIILFGGSRYTEDYVGPKKNGQSEFITYPFNNPYIFIFNVDEDYISINDNYALPYGVNFNGTQVIFNKKKLFFIGNLNVNSFYTNISNPDFTEENNSQKILGSISRDKIEVLDYIMFK